MSVFVSEILEDLKQNPNSFRDFDGQGVKKDEVTVYGYGNWALLSIVRVQVNGTKIPTSYRDNFRLERAITKWYKKVPLDILKDK